MSIGKRGALIQGARGGPENSIQARFKIYEGTDRNHHDKDKNKHKHDKHNITNKHK